MDITSDNKKNIWISHNIWTYLLVVDASTALGGTVVDVYTVFFKDPDFSQRSIERKSMIFSESLRRCSKNLQRAGVSS